MFGKRWAAVLWLSLFITVLGSSGFAYSRALSSAEYDGEIKKAVTLYWADFPDWKFWKAQLYQESLLEPNAVSSSGARGLAQFMPATWAEASRVLQLNGASPHAVRPAIQAGAWYMAKLRRAWTANRTALQRHELAEASYNAGMGNILKAQRICGMPYVWAGVSPCLVHVTGIRARETLTYVARINTWRAQLAGPAP